ncbi:MAG TPA: nuclear transport factor 2 family protein [Acidimicrobiales bacterium]|nr:nuclear transport factor 2 family protein [Acidimicrobiales bacterium]
MGRYPRSEIEEAFAHYQEVGARAGATKRWDEWAEMFTEDATYVEHHYGRFQGREEIRAWVSKTMAEPINDDMVGFPMRWYLIDEERSWVLCCVINRMRDPGDGTVHEADNWSRLEYAGNGQWSAQEDMYNPNEFASMIGGWLRANKASGCSDPDEGPTDGR